MKSGRAFLFLIALSFTTIYFGCSKSDNTPAAKVIVPTSAPDTRLCDGTGHNINYYPLDSTDSWSYSYTINNVHQGSVPVLTNLGHHRRAFDTINKYSMLIDPTTWINTDTSFLREDTLSHNIYNYNVAAAVEYLEVPAAPSLGDNWSVGGVFTKKVTSLSTQITATDCWYTNLMEITVFNGTTIIAKYYYKRGFGLVDKKDVSATKEYLVKAIHFI